MKHRYVFDLLMDRKVEARYMLFTRPYAAFFMDKRKSTVVVWKEILYGKEFSETIQKFYCFEAFYCAFRSYSSNRQRKLNYNKSYFTFYLVFMGLRIINDNLKLSDVYKFTEKPCISLIYTVTLGLLLSCLVSNECEILPTRKLWSFTSGPPCYLHHALTTDLCWK